jgi:hypothetical protein
MPSSCKCMETILCIFGSQKRKVISMHWTAVDKKTCSAQPLVTTSVFLVLSDLYFISLCNLSLWACRKWDLYCIELHLTTVLFISSMDIMIVFLSLWERWSPEKLSDFSRLHSQRWHSQK